MDGAHNQHHRRPDPGENRIPDRSYGSGDPNHSTPRGNSDKSNAEPLGPAPGARGQVQVEQARAQVLVGPVPARVRALARGPVAQVQVAQAAMADQG